MGSRCGVTELAKLTEVLKSGKRPDLRDLGKAVHADLKEVDVLEWYAFEDTVCNSYGITSEEFYKILLPPMFTKRGKYVDDFSPLMERMKIRGWLGRYVEHTRMAESPTVFHFAAALAVLGSSLHREIWIDQAIYKIYPACRVFLLGPSGYTHKSTCANYAIKIGEDSGRVNRLMDEGSQEGLKKQLSKISKKTGSATGILYSSELGTLLGKQDYNIGMVQAMTDLFDNRDSITRGLASKPGSKLQNIAVSAIWCSNEEWAVSSIPASAFGGGLMSRILVFFQASTDRSFPRPEKPPEGQREALVQMLSKTGIIRGEFLLSNDAGHWFDEKYHWIRSTKPEDERMEPMWSRYPDHLLTMGMIIAVSEMLEDAWEEKIALVNAPRVIERHHLQQADAVLQWLMRYLPKVYAFLGLTPFGAETTKIMQYIARKGGRASEKEIGRKMRISKRNLAEHLDTLVSYGYCHTAPSLWDVGVDYVLDRDIWEV